MDYRKEFRSTRPPISAIFQAEHLSPLVGNGFTSAIAYQADAKPTTMDRVTFGCPHESEVNAYAKASAAEMGRDEANIEDQFSAALALLPGLKITNDKALAESERAIDRELGSFVRTVLSTERGISNGLDHERVKDGAVARDIIVSFLIVSSHILMVQSFRVIRRMRYGTGSTRERHDDGGGPSSDTA
jgi:hypothetical protein